ncbi:MAG: hypothetical protein NZ954_08465 [Thermofilaceae archaeon]|nr:hypothetical protein [Thermofilaceae archaeon]MDW8004945.1 hypothetical protein [Thermofilaceae archaeon]
MFADETWSDDSDLQEVLKKVTGRSGLQEVLEEKLGEGRALAIIYELSEILQSHSPFRDSVIEVLDPVKQLYAIANLRRLILARAKLIRKSFKYKEIVATVAPVKVIVYENSLGDVTKYEIVFEGATLKEPLTVGPASLEEIIERLKAEGVVRHPKLIRSVLNAIVQSFIRKGKAEIRIEE